MARVCGVNQQHALCTNTLPILGDCELPLLEGKRILVTGAASGIGKGATALFLKWGASLFATDRDGGALSASWSENAAVATSAMDVTDEEQCVRGIAAAAEALGGIDGAFHSAGVSDVVASATDILIEDWQHVVDVNLRGSFLVARTVARHMLSHGRGSIVLLSSINGINGIPRRHAYGPAKAAVAQLTRTLACEWGLSSVRVNALAPNYIRTPMIERLVDESQVDISRLERRTPMGRIGEVEDVARAAAFLLSDWSAFITGAVLPVDGGWLAYGGAGDVATA